MVDYAYLNGYAKICGVSASMVYLTLCRHAGNDQKCWVSMEMIADKIAITKRTVVRSIKTLESHNIINVIREKGEDGKQKNNIYYLADKKHWSKTPSDNISPGKPGDIKDQNRVTKTADLPGDTRALEGNTTSMKKVNCIEGICDEPSAVADLPADKSSKKGTAQSPDEPMSEAQFVEWCRKSPMKHVRLIGEWADQVHPPLNTKAQWGVYIKRNVRAAKALDPFTPKQISDAYCRIEEIQKDRNFSPSLETLLKQLTK